MGRFPGQPLGGIGVRRTPQSRYVVRRTSTSGREGEDRKTTQLPTQRHRVTNIQFRWLLVRVRRVEISLVLGSYTDLLVKRKVPPTNTSEGMLRVRSGTLSRFEIPAKMFSARDIAVCEKLSCSGIVSVWVKLYLGLATPANCSFCLDPQTPPDCVTICDAVCYSCEANVTNMHALGHSPPEKEIAIWS